MWTPLATPIKTKATIPENNKCALGYNLHSVETRYSMYERAMAPTLKEMTNCAMLKE